MSPTPRDVRDVEFCNAAVEATVDTFGWIDIVVNNAAYHQHQNSIDELTDEQFERTFRTNIFGYFYMARAAKAHMQPASAIINTGSITGIQGSKQLLDYSATKRGDSRAESRVFESNADSSYVTERY